MDIDTEAWIIATSHQFAWWLVQEAEMQERNMFGWSLPPGVSLRDIEEAMGDGEEMDAIIASECDIDDELAVLVVNEQGEKLHTADRPFCRDMRCTCHNDPVLWRAYIYYPWLEGIQTLSAAAALFSGR